MNITSFFEPLHDALHELAVGGQVPQLVLGHLVHHLVVLQLLLPLEDGHLLQSEDDRQSVVEFAQRFYLLLQIRDVLLQLLDLLVLGPA